MKEQIRRDEQDVTKTIREILENLNLSEDEWAKAVRETRNER